MDTGKKDRELDLKGIHSFDRHMRFFDVWRKLKEGESVKIKTDASPDLLKSQFEAEHPGSFEWDYEKNGPDELPPKKWTQRRVGINIDTDSQTEVSNGGKEAPAEAV